MEEEEEKELRRMDANTKEKIFNDDSGPFTSLTQCCELKMCAERRLSAAWVRVTSTFIFVQ